MTVASDSRLTVSLNIPDVAGEYKVTVASGNASYEGTFTVKDTSAYKVGQIVLADGTLVEPNAYTKIDTANPPIAVVWLNDYGVAYGVGLHTSPSLQWATSGTTGCNTSFTDIIGSTSSGDIDGSDNWDVICSVDPEGSKDAATNYPAFNWANSYGTTYSEQLGGVTEGWYMPAVAELYQVYENREAINKALSVINNLNSSYATSLLETSYFWSSSQHYKYYNVAWIVNFSTGLVLDYNKDVSLNAKTINYSVLVVRAF